MTPRESNRFTPLGLLFVLSLAGWLGVAGIGCGSRDGESGGGAAEIQASEKKGDDGDRVAVKVAPVRREPLSELYSTSANLRADARATVTARTKGVVRKLLVEEGDRVEEGQPLAELEDDEQRLAVSRSKAIRELRQNEYQRTLTLTEQGVLSDNDFEVVRREAEEARHAAELAQLNLERTVIRAPFSGRILTRYLDVGAMVGDGTSVYELADLDPLYADVNVPERHIGRLSPGQTVRVFADLGEETWEARIERIAPMVDPSTGTVKVTLAVSESAGLKPGSFVRVSVVTDTHENALVVSRSALVAEGRRWHLFRLAEDGEGVELLEVSPGFEEGDRVEILSVTEGEGSLEPGDLIVVAGASALNEKSKVQVAADETGAASDGSPSGSNE